MWPASALLTGNGVAFVLRVPGTEHGDWWSMNGWWIFAGTSAIALLSKYLIRIRGRHIFNPSNFGLVLCFLLLGAERADPLALWWGPLSPALVFAIGLIVAGGFLILRRLHLVGIAVGFWLAFAAGIGVLAASGHTMTAAWHVGPIEGAEFWWLLVSSPEILVFLFFMITDPKTTPASARRARVYAVCVGLLATLLIAPQTTEFGTKVAILAALALVCAARGADRARRLRATDGSGDAQPRRPIVGRRPRSRARSSTADSWSWRASRRGRSRDRGRRQRRPGSPRDHGRATGGVAAIDDAPRRRSRATSSPTSRRVGSPPPPRRRAWRRTAASGDVARIALAPDPRRVEGDHVASYDVDTIADPPPKRRPGPADGRGELEGTRTASTFRSGGAAAVERAEPAPFRRTLESPRAGAYRIVQSREGPFDGAAGSAPRSGRSARRHVVRRRRTRSGSTSATARSASAMSQDTTAMMGGGLCWLDYDSDGWLDLFVVNSHADVDIVRRRRKGGLPRSALYHNVGGRFVDVSGGPVPTSRFAETAVSQPTSTWTATPIST